MMLCSCQRVGGGGEWGERAVGKDRWWEKQSVTAGSGDQ